MQSTLKAVEKDRRMIFEEELANRNLISASALEEWNGDSGAATGDGVNGFAGRDETSSSGTAELWLAQERSRQYGRRW